MRQSNGYILLFTVIMTLLVGGILAGTSIVLGPAQKKSIELDTKSQILSAVRDLVQLKEGADVLAVYDQRIESIVVDYNGNEVTQDSKGNPMVAEDVNVGNNFKLPAKDRLYPVFKLVDAANPGQIEAYIVPVYGNGLWDRIWGFVALDANFETILGASFDHRAETPGLGQRIATQEIQSRYVGKKIRNEQGALVSVNMVKGERGGGQQSIQQFQDRPHEVDGMSGATLTAKGVNEMLKSYLRSYENYFEKVKGAGGDVATAP